MPWLGRRCGRRSQKCAIEDNIPRAWKTPRHEFSSQRNESVQHTKDRALPRLSRHLTMQPVKCRQTLPPNVFFPQPMVQHHTSSNPDIPLVAIPTQLSVSKAASFMSRFALSYSQCMLTAELHRALHRLLHVAMMRVSMNLYRGTVRQANAACGVSVPARFVSMQPPSDDGRPTA